MRKTLAVVALVALSGALMIGFTVGRSTAAGGPKSYFAVLNTGQQEQEPGPTGAGLGVAHFVLLPDRNICTNMTVTGLSSPINNAHIHGPAKAGSAAIPVIQLNVETDGVWKNDCSDDHDDKLTKAEVEFLNRGQLYVNVHTDDFTPGEVRGQIHK